jgi:hypothetical protein
MGAIGIRGAEKSVCGDFAAKPGRFGLRCCDCEAVIEILSTCAAPVSATVRQRTADSDPDR